MFATTATTFDVIVVVVNEYWKRVKKNTKSFSFVPAQCVSVIFAICLPAVSVSIYFYSSNQQNECKSIDMKMSTDNNVIVAVEKSKNHDNEITQRNEPKPQFSFSLAVKRIAEHFRTSYSNLVVVQWSILWAMAMCGFLQVCAPL